MMPLSRRDLGIAPSVSSRMTRGSLSWTGAWTFRWLCLRIALASLFLQGVTPDANDLSSSLLFEWLDRVPSRGKRDMRLSPPWISGSRACRPSQSCHGLSSRLRTRNENRLRTRFVLATDSASRHFISAPDGRPLAIRRKSRPSRLSPCVPPRSPFLHAPRGFPVRARHLEAPCGLGRLTC